MAASKTRGKDRTIFFEIKTLKPLSIGEQIFVAGSVDMLGRWKPDGFPLTRMGENSWSGSALLPVDTDIEYKITRGSWESEEVSAEGVAPMNSILPVGGPATIRREIVGWKDETTPACQQNRESTQVA